MNLEALYKWIQLIADISKKGYENYDEIYNDSSYIKEYYLVKQLEYEHIRKQMKGYVFFNNLEKLKEWLKKRRNEYKKSYINSNKQHVFDRERNKVYRNVINKIKDLEGIN